MRIYERHSDTLIEIAKALREFQSSESGRKALEGSNGRRDLSDLVELHAFLDRFFISRIGIRVLIGHYLEICEQTDSTEDALDTKVVGILNLNVSPAEVAMAAVQDATYMCERQYGDAPSVEMLGRTDLTFPYVASHLYYILFEVIKNSMRAVVEHHGIGKPLPEIRIVVADGEDKKILQSKSATLEEGSLDRS